MPGFLKVIEKNPLLSSGVVEVEVVRLVKNAEGEWQKNLFAGTPSAFDLCFRFRRAVNDQIIPIATETTLWEDNDLDDPWFGSGADVEDESIELPPGRDEYSSDNMSWLKSYKDVFLPQRRDQIANLEASLAMIQEALHDPQLNSWYPEHQRQTEQEKTNQGAKPTGEQLDHQPVDRLILSTAKRIGTSTVQATTHPPSNP